MRAFERTENVIQFKKGKGVYVRVLTENFYRVSKSNKCIPVFFNVFNCTFSDRMDGNITVLLSGYVNELGIAVLFSDPLHHINSI